MLRLTKILLICVVFHLKYSIVLADDQDEAFKASKESYLKMFMETDPNQARQMNANRMSQLMNNTVDPCQDFYTYACGNYNKVMPNKYVTDEPDFQRIITKDVMRDFILYDPANEAEGKLKVFFDKCMDFTPEQENLKSIARRFLSILYQYWDTATHWQGALFEWSIYGLPSWISFRTTKTYITADEVITPLTKWNTSSVEEYLEKAEEIYTYFGLESVFRKSYVRKSHTLERSLPYLHLAVREDGPEILDIEKIVSKIIRKRIPDYQPNSVLYSRELRLARYLHAQDEFELEAILEFHFLVQLKDFIDRFTDDRDERFDLCYGFAREYFWLGLASFYQRYRGVTDESRERLEIIENIRETLKQLVNDTEWMDEPTKNEALKKLDMVSFEVGLTKFLQNETSLKAHLANIDVDSGAFLETYFDVRYESFWAKMRNPFLQLYAINEDYSTDHLSPEVFSNSKGKIGIPLILQTTPLFDDYYPVYKNYAGFGTTVGRELMQIFGKYLMYDSQGEWREWWTEESSDGLESNNECFVTQYSRLAGFSQDSLDNTATIHIPESVSLLLGYKAYENMKDDPENYIEDYSILDMDMDQIFFLSFAQKYCTNEPNIAANKLKVTGAVINLPEFASAFSCPRGSPMNPKRKCKFF